MFTHARAADFTYKIVGSAMKRQRDEKSENPSRAIQNDGYMKVRYSISPVPRML